MRLRLLKKHLLQKTINGKKKYKLIQFNVIRLLENRLKELIKIWLKGFKYLMIKLIKTIPKLIYRTKY